MRKNKKQRKIYLYLLIILGITIGFALLSTTLFINGTANIKSNTWNIHWDSDSIEETTGSVTATTPASVTDAEEKNISFAVEFELPGDFYEFSADAVNEGSIDGKIETISIKFYEADGTTEIDKDDLPEEITYSLTHKDGTAIAENEVIAHGGTISYKFRIGFNSEITTLPSNNIIVKPDIEITPVQHKEKCATPVSFSEDSWETIACNVRAGNTSAYNVGDTKSVMAFGPKTVRIANKSTPAECKQPGFSQTACGFVIEFEANLHSYPMNPEANPDGVIESNNQYNGVKSKGGWKYSMMRDYLNTTAFTYLPSDLQSVIVDTTVVSSHNDQDTENFVTTDKLYLLATHEIWNEGELNNYGIDVYDSAYNNTRQLDYYKSIVDSGITSLPDKSGSPSSWWLRSAYGDSSTSFYYVGYGGSLNNRPSVTSLGISPAFKIG